MKTERKTGRAPASRIERTRSELEYVLTEKPINPAFPRSRTMRLLNGSGPMLLAGLALGLMLVKPRWGRKAIRLLPAMRMLKRLQR